MGAATFNTIDPENLQAIYGSRVKDWGVEPVRLAAMEPLCGRGFITTDGETWERSRALLKPSFSRAHIENVFAFESAVDEFFRRLPLDGSTVDLGPLLSELVSDLLGPTCSMIEMKRGERTYGGRERAKCNNFSVPTFELLASLF